MIFSDFLTICHTQIHMSQIYLIINDLPNFISLITFWCLFFDCRIVVNRSKMVHSSIMKVCHIVRRIIMRNVALCVLAAQNQSPADASQQCSVNSIRNILYALFAWNSLTKAHLKNKMIDHIVMNASTNCSVKSRAQH